MEHVDIVTRLRQPEQWRSFPDMDDDAPREAAKVIERLRKLLWMIQDQNYRPSGYLMDAIEAAVKYD